MVIHSIDSYDKIGQLDILIDYLIDYFLDSSSYYRADQRFDIAIRPILERLSSTKFIKLIEGIDNNNQIFGRARSKRDNNLIVKYSVDKLGQESEYYSYDNFDFDLTILDDNAIPF